MSERKKTITTSDWRAVIRAINTLYHSVPWVRKSMLESKEYFVKTLKWASNSATTMSEFLSKIKNRYGSCIFNKDSRIYLQDLHDLPVADVVVLRRINSEAAQIIKIEI